jgi:peptidyl-prolyl cis-trans isomerase A (cyclophilin A)
MMIRILTAAFLTAASVPAFAQAPPAGAVPPPASALAQAPAPAPAPAPAAELVPVSIETSAGRIVIALDKTHAPISTANFLHYVDTHRYDGETFYRAMHVGDGGIIQGGIQTNGLKLFAPIKHEPTSQTGLHNVAGAISMANAGPGTARADFFILASDIPSFDAAAEDPGYAVFGHVVEGMDVVNKILASPVSATKGEGAMKGQMLDPPVKIIKAERVNPSKP